MTAGQIIELLNLEPHPEGGHFIETFRDATASGGRAASTAIYFLLMRGERSSWHRIDAAEVWHYYAGAPLELEVADTDQGPVRRLRLGIDLLAGERPQAVVPRGAWQAAKSLGDWTLAGCTVAPGFAFTGFELAPQGWTPRP
ncbi:MAG TPA: cupin domain-containing protein [Xanthobacteraceae bacterium]|jgi:predicted cupin superfamily sugar epimerase|nr:cupin domain-containing protein [Xanthobacteraceae bacterium]